VSAYDPIIELVYLFNHPLTQFSYKNKEAVDLLSQSKELIDREEYVESLKNIHSRLLSDYRVLPIIHTRMLYVTNSEYTLEDLNHFDGGLSLWDWKLK
jgi:ABC-type oligopeptide transport system substrate-binding subunit